MVTVDHDAIFAGGIGNAGSSNAVDIYNARTGQWRTAKLPWAPQWPQAVTAGHYAIFASDGSGVVDVYDTRTNKWAALTPSRAHAYFAATSVNGVALLAGGLAPQGQSDIVAIFNSHNGRWSTVRLSQERKDFAVAVVGHFAIFAGGQGCTSNGGWSESRAVDIYDAKVKRWTTAKLSEARYFLTAATANHYAIFAGGRHLNSPGVPTCSDRVDIYDANSGRWSHSTLLTPRYAMGAITVNGQAIFAGGIPLPQRGQPTTFEGDAVDVCEANARQWQAAQLSCPRSAWDGMVAVVAGHDALLVGGNRSERGVTADIYNALTQK